MVEAAVVVVVATTTPNKQQNQKWNDIIVITTLLSLFVDELMWYENQTYEHYGSENRMYVYMYRSSSRQIPKKSSDDPFHHHETVFVGDEFCRSIRGTNIEWFLIVTLFETQMMVGQRQIIEFMVSPMISASFLFPICIECVI